MSISLLRMRDFRNIAALDIAPQTCGLNVIYGKNGSGKSSLLEAIHYLGHGKSFRTATPARLIKHTKDKFSIFAQLESENDHSIPVGVEREVGGQMRVRLGENDVTNFVDVVALLPVRVINSQTHQLFESGPQFRRKYIDWGLFYHNVQFHLCWRNFERALKQRNMLLSAKSYTKELETWTQAVAQYGLELHKFRSEYVLQLLPYFALIAKQLLPLENFVLNYQAGWDDSIEYADILAKNRAEDLHIGYTQYGPQRADLLIKTNGILVKHFLSRGQQKLLVCAMILAQGLLLAKIANKRLIYLVDDLPSELDLESRERLISLLTKQETQIFITAIEPNTICDFISEPRKVPMNVFHVEQGSINELM